MSIDLPDQPVSRPTSRVKRGVSPRDLERELAQWRCDMQEAIGDEPVPLPPSLG